MTVDRRPTIAAPTPRGPISMRCVAGPDAGWSLRLDAGSHWLGRVDDGIRISDSTIEAHHARVDVARDGSAMIIQTAGRTPVLVDGAAAHRWTAVKEGSTIELGATRLEVGAGAPPVAAPMAWVFEPQVASAAEHARFARDVGLAAATARFARIARPDDIAVELGVAFVELDIDVRTSDGDRVAIGDLDHAAQAIVERACRTAVPLWVTLPDEARIAIVAAEPTVVAVADAMTVQLPAERRAGVIVTAADDAESLAGSHRPMLLLARDLLDVPPWCGAVLEVGATWRATWRGDVHRHPEEVVRLHARGSWSGRRVPSRSGAGQPTPAGRSSLRR